MVKKLFTDEKGGTLPLVTIILGLFALGFMALIIDVGIIFIDRKAMITSADAAALAGAQTLRVNQKAIKLGQKTASQVKSEAELSAKNYAIANGADESQIIVSISQKQVTLPNGATEVRQIVEVTVGQNQPLLFAKFLGDNNAEVKAHSIATWGYVYKSYIGDFLPLFIFDENYQSSQDLILHDRIDSTNSYGFIDIGGGMNNIKAALSGTNVGGTYIENNILEGEPGQGDALRLGIEDRMIKAQSKDTPEARRKTMIGLVPIIDKEKFLNIPANLGGNANKFQLPIKYFAYFEITDVIKKNSMIGSSEALNPLNEYKKVSSPINYSNKLSGQGVEYTYVLGKFTGEVVNARTIVEIGDQVDPNPQSDITATYSKLIK